MMWWKPPGGRADVLEGEQPGVGAVHAELLEPPLALRVCGDPLARYGTRGARGRLGEGEEGRTVVFCRLVGE